MKSMPRSNGMGEGVNNGVATNIRSRNHINTTPMLRTDLTRANWAILDSFDIAS